MHGLAFHVAVVWTGLLIAGGLLVLLRARSPFTRILAIETTLLLVVGFLLIVALDAGRALYVDAAIALALVGFTTTVALARVERDADR
jgi:multicomponent Na+:H+ antiporter subunit F